MNNGESNSSDKDREHYSSSSQQNSFEPLQFTRRQSNAPKITDANTKASQEINRIQNRPSPAPKTTRGLSDNLRSQTPLNRALKKQSAPAEPGTVRRTNAPQHFKVQSDLKGKPKSRSNNKKSISLFSFMLIMGFIMYALLASIVLISFKLALPSHSSKHTGDYTYQLGPDENVYSKKIYSYSKVKVGNEYYVNMDSIAEYCALTTTGNDECMRYVVRSSGDYVEFEIGQSIAYINGVQERTGAIVMLKNGTVYVPLSFAQRCFKGITIELNEEDNKITIVRLRNSDGEYVDLSFPYKLPNTSNRIIFADLDADIQEIIIMQNQPKLPESPDVETNGDDQ